MLAPLRNKHRFMRFVRCWQTSQRWENPILCKCNWKSVQHVTHGEEKILSLDYISVVKVVIFLTALCHQFIKYNVQLNIYWHTTSVNNIKTKM